MEPERAPLSVLVSNTIRLWAGAERFALDAASGLRQRGHAIAVEAYPGAPLFERARAAGIPVWGTRVHGDWAPWTLLPVAARLRREPVDVVWTMRDKDLRNAALAAHLARRGISVVHSRECDEPIKPERYNRWIYEHVPHRLVVNSEATRRTTLASAPWLSRQRVELLPKGIDPKPWERAAPGDWPRRMGRREGELVLGFAGQLVPRKGVDRLLRLLAHALLRARRWRLVLAGAGPQEAALRSLAEELGLAERVVFCGFVEDLPAWMASLDLFVLPSRIEGFGYVLAEAMASGLPVVAWASSSVPEVVSHGRSGLLAPPDDEDAFARALLQLIEDPELRRRMGAQAREEARERHGLARMIDSMEEILYRARGTRGPRAGSDRP